MKKLSIIVPMYNAQNCIIKCLESIICQSYDNYELVIVNDGSVDESQRIVEEFIDDKENVYLYNTPNSGVSHARNFGIDKVTGDYVTFIDADDFINTDTLAVIMNILNNNDIDCLKYGYTKRIGNVKRDYVFQCETDKLLSKNQFSEMVFPNIILNNDFSSVWNLVIKRNLLDEIRFDEKKRYAEDRKFNFDVLQSADNIYICSAPLYNYVINNKSVMNNIDREKSIIQILDAVDTNYYIYKSCKTYNLRNALENSINNDISNLVTANFSTLSYNEYKKNINELISVIEEKYKDYEILSYLKGILSEKNNVKMYFVYKIKYLLFVTKKQLKKAFG